MYAPNLTLPFTTEDSLAGMAQTEGLLRVHAKGMQLEFQTKDSVFGVVKSGVKKVAIGLEELQEVEFKASFWGSRFRIYLGSMETLSKIPGAKEGAILLKIKRRDKAKAKEMESYLKMHLSEHRLKMLGESTDYLLD